MGSPINAHYIDKSQYGNSFHKVSHVAGDKNKIWSFNIQKLTSGFDIRRLLYILFTHLLKTNEYI